MSTKLKVNFILPAIGKTGGVLVVLEYARQLQLRGHEARVYYPLFPYGAYFKEVPLWKRFPGRIKYFFVKIRDRHRRISWLPESCDLRPVPFISNFFISDADVTLATAWPTAFDVAKLSPSKGGKFYFIQDYEIWRQDAAVVDASYRLPLKLLVIAPWLAELMRTRFGREVTAEIHNGIDLDFFHPPVEKLRDPKSILMMHHILESKGIPDGLEALRRIHKLHPEVRIRMFGMSPFPDKDDFIEYFRDPSPEKLRELYQASQIFLSPSLSEGWGLTVVEALACGCAVVATNVGCVPVLKNGENLLSVEPGDRESLFQNVESLIENPLQAEKLGQRGRESVLHCDWKESSRQLEEVLQRA